MKVRTTLSVLLGLSPAILLACSCVPTSTSFSLLDYDQAKLIVEVVAGDRFGREQVKPDYDLETYQAQVQKAKAAGRVPPPPPPRRPDTGKASARVETVFKGRLDTNELILKSDIGGASCGWLPRPGVRYILYLYSPQDDQGETVYWVSSCSRKRIAEYNGYSAEKQFLTALSKAEDGEIKEVQQIKSNNGAVEFSPFKGRFKDGLRDGKWLIYPPVYFWKDTIDLHQPSLVFEYDQGELISTIVLKKEPLKNAGWLRKWRSHYRPDKDPD